MDDYIKREDAIKWLTNLQSDCGQFPQMWHYGEALEQIIKLFDSDVAPVRHGHWIVLQQTSIPTIWNCKCSECGAYETKTSNYQANYCPNCGAKMDYNEWLASKDR